MVHIKRFMLPFPNLISIEEFRHHARALFTLLRKASRSASYCSSRLLVSPWQLEYITSRNAQSFYLRRLVFHYGALSSSSPPRTHDVSVVDTSLIYYGYFKNTKNLFIHIARILIGDSPRVHPNIFKMSPPFASSEGVSASGVRYQSDGECVTHLLPHS